MNNYTAAFIQLAFYVFYHRKENSKPSSLTGILLVINMIHAWNSRNNSSTIEMCVVSAMTLKNIWDKKDLNVRKRFTGMPSLSSSFPLCTYSHWMS